MKYLFFAAGILAGAAHAADAPTSGQLTLPYSEFRQLLEKSMLPPEKRLPVSQATLSTRLRLEVRDKEAVGSVQFKVLNLAGEAALVPLIGDSVMVMRVEPPETILVRKDGFYQILAAPSMTVDVTLQIGCSGRHENQSTIFQYLLAPSAIVSLSLAKLPEGQKAEIPGAQWNSETGEYHLAGQKQLALHVMAIQKEQPLREVVTMPAVISEATATMRLVSDGTFLNSTTWVIRHNKALVWGVSPGAETQLVSAKVDGHPIAPVLGSDSRLEFHLPENPNPTRVELNYTGKTTAFGPVRGDLSVSLPSTDLLIERTDWQLLLPSGYAPVAVEGNTDFLPGELTNEIRLRKELSRNEAPSVRIYYQKPETNKNL